METNVATLKKTVNQDYLLFLENEILEMGTPILADESIRKIKKAGYEPKISDDNSRVEVYTGLVTAFFEYDKHAGSYSSGVIFDGERQEVKNAIRSQTLQHFFGLMSKYGIGLAA